MTLNQAIDRYTNNAEYERIHGSLQGCLEFRQLAEWLKDYKRLLEQQPCEDAVSREAALKECHNIVVDGERYRVIQEETLLELPPVTPQQKTGHCKDCKWWKDSDGVYRRGVGAESKCPINNVSVNHGLGYCYMYEPQESEEKE